MFVSCFGLWFVSCFYGVLILTSSFPFLGIFAFRSYDKDRFILIDFGTAPGTAGVFRAIGQFSLSLAFCTKFGIASLAVQDFAKICSATARAAIIIFSHNDILRSFSYLLYFVG